MPAANGLPWSRGGYYKGHCCLRSRPGSPLVGWSQRNERSFMMNHDGWMGGGWMGGGMWLWTVIGVLVVVLLVVLINKVSKK